jgi:hypothetical protein
MDEESRFACIETDVKEIRKRVYNGLGAELRAEVEKGLARTNTLVVSILISVLLALAGIVVQNRVEANQHTLESDRNYTAIMQLDKKLEIHLIQSGKS